MNQPSAVSKQSVESRFDEYRRDLELANQELKAEIDERRRAEAALHAIARRLDHQHAAQVAILSARSLSDTLDITIRHINNSLPCLSSTIIIYDFDRGESEILRSDHPDYKAGQRAPIRLWAAVEAMRLGNPYILRQLADLVPNYPEIQATVDLGGQTLLMVPLQYRDNLIGALGIVTDHIHDFTPEELVISREIASTLAIAIQHRRWLMAEQEAREREATLRQVAQSLTADLDLDSVLREILDQLEKLVPTASSGIFLREGDQIRVAASRGLRASPDLIKRFAADLPVYMREMMDSATPVIIQDVAQDPNYIVIEGGEYIQSWMGIPLAVKGVGLGLLTLDRERRNAFSEEDLVTASILAAQAAIGIQNARLYAAQQEYGVQMEKAVTERTRELQALYEISAGNENLELEELLVLSLKRTLNAVGYTAGMIHVVDEVTETLTMVAVLGLPYSVLNELDPQTPGGRVFHEKLANVDILWSSSLASESNIRFCAGYESYIIAPLRAQGHTLGTLTLLCDEDRTLPSESLRLLAAIADQIGLAVESADLRRQARQTAVLAERERIAADLHDMVTQSLYSLILFSEAARETGVQGDIEEMQRNLQNIMKIARLALGEMRTLLYDLRSDALAGMGLAGALAFRLATVEQPSGLMTELIVQNADDLPPAVEEVLYRIALESLTNILRHASAHSVEVIIAIADGSVILTIDDDGIGFSVDDTRDSPGMGLRNMRGRIYHAGGALLIQSAPGQGTRIEARIPMSQSGTARASAQVRQTARKETYYVDDPYFGG